MFESTTKRRLGQRQTCTRVSLQLNLRWVFQARALQPKYFHSLLPILKTKNECSFYLEKQAQQSAANIFIGTEMSVDPTPEDENLLNEVQVDAIFDSLTSSDFEADTFIRSLLNDTGLDMGDCWSRCNIGKRTLKSSW